MAQYNPKRFSGLLLRRLKPCKSHRSIISLSSFRIQFSCDDAIIQVLLRSESSLNTEARMSIADIVSGSLVEVGVGVGEGGELGGKSSSISIKAYMQDASVKMIS